MAVTLLLLATGSARAQIVSEDSATFAGARARLQAELDKEMVSVRAARLRQDALQKQASRPTATGLDTLAVGPFQVVTWAADVQRVGRVAEDVWQEDYMSWTGPVARPIATLEPIIVQTDRDHRIQSPSQNVATWAETPEQRRAELRSRMGVALQEALPEGLRRWYGTRTLQAVADYGMRYRSLLLSPSIDARDCVDGVVAGCIRALGLTDPGDSDAGALDSWARASLLTFALERGGPQAFGRMLRAHGSDESPRVTLERAADVDIGTLVAAWRTRVFEAAPAHRGADERRDRRLAFAWVTLCALLAMTSTRWRLGR
jgi:hypothetical protein